MIIRVYTIRSYLYCYGKLITLGAYSRNNEEQ